AATCSRVGGAADDRPSPSPSNRGIPSGPPSVVIWKAWKASCVIVRSYAYSSSVIAPPPRYWSGNACRSDREGTGPHHTPPPGHVVAASAGRRWPDRRLTPSPTGSNPSGPAGWATKQSSSPLLTRPGGAASQPGHALAP